MCHDNVRPNDSKSDKRLARDSKSRTYVAGQSARAIIDVVKPAL